MLGLLFEVVYSSDCQKNAMKRQHSLRVVALIKAGPVVTVSMSLLDKNVQTSTGEPVTPQDILSCFHWSRQ